MNGGKNPNWLIVEGIADRQAVLGLIRAHTDWSMQPRDLDQVPVFIYPRGGVSEILSETSMGVTMKTKTIRNLGVIVDGNSDPNARYRSLRNRCLKWFPTIPEELSESGLIVENSDGRRFGAWIMPNNKDSGALETLLNALISNDSLYPRINAFIDSVSSVQAIDVKYLEKSLLYAWMAVQKPPIQDLNNAFAKRILDPMHPKLAAFVTWFLELYGLPRRIPTEP